MARKQIDFGVHATETYILERPSLPPVRLGLLVRAFWALLAFDVKARLGGFAAVRGWVERPSVGRAGVISVAEVLNAVERACAWYPKTAACLQRSAALTRLLTQGNIAAELVIGVQKFPFRSHAWVEVNGEVINDRPRVREVYKPIARLARRVRGM